MDPVLKELLEDCECLIEFVVGSSECSSVKEDEVLLERVRNYLEKNK